MEDIFNDIDKNKISEYHDYCHNSSSWPEKSPISHVENTIWHWIEKNHPNAWVAILDDDDEWLPDHLEVCRAHSAGVDAVISGIRTLVDGEFVEDRIPSELSLEDFFANNPGWQGSNTFVRVSKLIEAGGFDEDLLCTHDRDLAIRCFDLPEFNYILTGEVTMLYHLEKSRDSLTMAKGNGKHTGLLQFHRKYKLLEIFT